MDYQIEIHSENFCIYISTAFSWEGNFSNLVISAMLGVSVHFILKNGPDYVDQPRLIHLHPVRALP